MHENAIFSPSRGGGRTRGTPYAESATVYEQETDHIMEQEVDSAEILYDIFYRGSYFKLMIIANVIMEDVMIFF